jgi:hypothetical protein
MPTEGHGSQLKERVPGAAQHEVVRCRSGTVTGPGSAAHRYTSFRAAPHPGHVT